MHRWPDHGVLSHEVKKNPAKIRISEMVSKPQQAIYFQKLVDKMCKYEMDLASIVEDTERTRFCLQADGWTNRVKPVYRPPPPHSTPPPYSIGILWVQSKQTVGFPPIRKKSQS